MPSFNIRERIREAAEGGDAFAQFELAIDLDYGNNGEQDFEKAAFWYAKAASQGHDTAESNLLMQHIFGQARLKQPEEVFAQLQTRASSGDREAQNNLGLCFQHGYGTTQDYNEAAKWFRRSAEGGLGTAQFNLGGLYFEGKGFPKDPQRAAEWYTRAAEQREELALLQLGNMYEKGIGVEKNVNRSLILYLIAYRRGSSRAANHLGFMFRKGRGVERDDSLAYELFLESLGPDRPDAPENLSYRGTAYYCLGRMAENGEGVKRDLRAAKQFYSRGAACGDANCKAADRRLLSKTLGKRCRSKSS